MMIKKGDIMNQDNSTYEKPHPEILPGEIYLHNVSARTTYLHNEVAKRCRTIRYGDQAYQNNGDRCGGFPVFVQESEFEAYKKIVEEEAMSEMNKKYKVGQRVADFEERRFGRIHCIKPTEICIEWDKQRDTDLINYSFEELTEMVVKTH